MADEECRDEDYSQLKDLRINLDQEVVGGGSGGFSLCLWIYLSSSARPSSVIIRQMPSDLEDEVPFLALNDENKLTLFPLMFLHKEAPSPDNSFLSTGMVHTSAETECPLESWVHVGCEVATNYMRLHVDGTLVGEKPLSFLSYNCEDNLKRITLVGNDGNDGKLQGCIHYVRVFPMSASIKDQFVKNPPVKLSLDDSCISDGVEEGGDGVWSIVGGKASCRRNFSLEVILLDAHGRSVHKEMEIVASLLYADNGIPVEKARDDAEAPLLISCDGLEFPSTDRPVTLLRGRATFKLKISQLSSKSDNRLFRVCFHTLHAQRYPFLEAYSHPIRCISRNRTIRTTGFGKRLISVTPFCNGTHSPGSNDGPRLIPDTYGDGHLQASIRSELMCNPPLKRLKIGHDKASIEIDANVISEQVLTSSELKSNYLEGTDIPPSDSESTDARNSESRWTRRSIESISDVAIFKYCLEGTHERSILLKEIVTSSSNQDMESFADQVCLYAGCSHHRYQILISRKLVQEGADTWKLIPRNNHLVPWADAVPEINRKFMSIANSSRGLSAKDLEVLRGVAGCGEDLGRDNFERMWFWLYPVALALSRDQLNAMWTCKSPKWVEGLITKEEAENSLRGPRRLQKPGTFVLRFPTSRSWPHPDAGSLVVTYVGADSTLHHRLISFDHRERSEKLLQALLLEEPELSQLGRVTREGLSLARDED